MIFPCVSFHYKLVLLIYREHECDLFNCLYLQLFQFCNFDIKINKQQNKTP